VFQGNDTSPPQAAAVSVCPEGGKGLVWEDRGINREDSLANDSKAILRTNRVGAAQAKRRSEQIMVLRPSLPQAERSSVQVVLLPREPMLSTNRLAVARPTTRPTILSPDCGDAAAASRVEKSCGPNRVLAPLWPSNRLTEIVLLSRNLNNRSAQAVLLPLSPRQSEHDLVRMVVLPSKRLKEQTRFMRSWPHFRQSETNAENGLQELGPPIGGHHLVQRDVHSVNE
jgi:hypothetical protein